MSTYNQDPGSPGTWGKYSSILAVSGVWDINIAASIKKEGGRRPLSKRQVRRPNYKSKAPKRTQSPSCKAKPQQEDSLNYPSKAP